MSRGWSNSGGVFDVPKRKLEIEQIEAESGQPDFWNDADRAKRLSKQKDDAASAIQPYFHNQTLIEEAGLLLELAEEADEDSAWREVEAKIAEIEQSLSQAEFQLMLSQPEDHLGAILTINSGAGGTESCDWAAMLTRMYLRYCEKKGYAAQIIDSTVGEEAGYKSVTISVDGEYAYGHLKAENGVHRLVRISPFDANKRRHTSFVSVFLSPQVDDTIEIVISPTDLRIDTFRAGGKGGQNVQKNDTAVRITHLPTNTVVQCQSERSQHQNKELAMKVLRSRLYEMELEKQRQAQAAVESTKKRVEWGSQIRSYVLHPYKLVKDHRTDFEVGNAEAVLDGEIDGLIQSFLLSENG